MNFKKNMPSCGAVVLCISLFAGCVTSTDPVIFPRIERRPDATYYRRGALSGIPVYDPASTEPWQVDLRSYDISLLDLRESLDGLLYASFDDRTIWPPAEKMPDAFDYALISELGADPGLGIRELHSRGVTGRGVGVAIIDQPLLISHREYADRLRLYEEIHVESHMNAQMHGPAVASIAVGRSVGVAPEADLYYIGSWTVDWDNPDVNDRWNFEYYAEAVHRILDVNKQLPPDRKIRVLSMSVGWSPHYHGYEQITTAVERAKKAGILVVCSSIEVVHGFRFHGLDRNPLSVPSDHSSYRPGSWWARRYYEDYDKGYQTRNRLLVPMDSRTTASPTGDEEYVFYRQGGWSWSIPWIAGLYALACQVEPEIDPEMFWSTAMKTGRTIEFTHNGEMISLEPVVDPKALIAALTSE